MQVDSFSRFFGPAPLPIAMVDRSDQVVATNRAFAEMVGAQRVGEHLSIGDDYRVTRWPLADSGEQLVWLQRVDDERQLWQASAIAHHLRNPLSGVSGALHILRDRLGLSESERGIFEAILDRLAALNQSVDALVDFSQPIEPRRRAISVLQVVRDSVARLADTGHHRVDVVIGPERDDAAALADSVLLKRAIIHILTNAAEASGDRGAISVAVKVVNDWCHVEVTDQGCGWSDEAQRRLGEAFFTTKSQHLGVGLAMAHRIAAAHGGCVALRRSDESGSTVAIELPIPDPIDVDNPPLGDQV